MRDSPFKISSPESRSGEGLGVTYLGAALDILLFFAKLLVGFFGNSRAMIADAVHSLSDVVTDVIVVWGLIAGSRPSDDCHHYGHGKMELMAELVLGAILVATGLGIAFDSLRAVLVGSVETPSLLVLPVAAVSVLSKEGLFQVTIRAARRTGIPSLVANAWNHRSDGFTSAGVLLGVGLAIYFPRLVVIDALVGLLVAAVIARMGFKIGWEAASKLVDTAPSRDFLRRMEGMILGVPGTRSVRNLKVRYVGHMIALEVHLGLDPGMSVRESHDIAREVKHTVMERDGRVFDVVVHVEPEERASGAPRGSVPV